MSKESKTTIQVSANGSAPTLQELYKNQDLAISIDDFNVLMSQEPPASWLKRNKYAGNSLYMPIDKVEFLLRRVFKQFKIEIIGQGIAFNGVWVSVRVHYVHPVTNEWTHHDGIGAEELQVKSGSSPSDLANINKGAIAMSFPKAKSQAIKDACHHIGRAFGSDLNRADSVPMGQDVKLHDVKRKRESERLIALINAAEDSQTLDVLLPHVEKFGDEEITDIFNARCAEIQRLNDEGDDELR